MKPFAANITVTTLVKPCRQSGKGFTMSVKVSRVLVGAFIRAVNGSTRVNLYFHQISESMLEGLLPFSPNCRGKIKSIININS
jgi:hypothetical protein